MRESMYNVWMLADMVPVLLPATAAFAVGIAMTPVLTRYLYAKRAWKKHAGKRALNGDAAHEFNRLHEHTEVCAPRMGGIVVWGSVVITTLLFALAAKLFPTLSMKHLDFLSRSGTWLPLSTLLVGSIVGLTDDLMVIRENGEGMPLRLRLTIVLALSLTVGWWFWSKLGVVTLAVPLGSPIAIGWLIVPLFVAVSLSLYASGVIDGIDGLSGGVFASIFAAYTMIAFVEHQTHLAAFCAAVVGGLLAFLWFNIPPARFYMSDTGTMGLTLSLAVVAFMTDALGGGVGVLVLPIIGMLLVATVASDIVQVFWKRFFGRKLLRVAPLHHHLEAIGWPGYKVVMRYWVLSVIFAFIGVIIALSSHL